MQEFARTYRGYSDEEIIRLHGDAASLTHEARSALFSELQRRGLRQEEVIRIQHEQAKHIAEFDKEQKQGTKERFILGLMSILGGAIGRSAARAFVERRKRIDRPTPSSENDIKS